MNVYNQPRRVAIESYHIAVDRYVEDVKRLNGVVSIYLMGGFGAPGLSDIDIVVVVSDDFDPYESGRLSTKGIDGYLFLHGPIVVPLRLAESVQTIFYASNLRVLFGPDVIKSFEELSRTKQILLARIYLIDFLESRFLQFPKDADSVDKRAWLTRLWSLVHSTFLFESVLGKRLGESEKRDLVRVKETRKEWLDKGRVSDKLFFEALYAGKRLAAALFMLALDECYGQPSLEKNKCIARANKRLCFSDDNKAPVYDRGQLSIFGRTLTKFYCELPSAYVAHLCCYDRSFCVRWKIPPEYSRNQVDLMKERAALVREHSVWLRKHAPRSGSMKGYLGIDVDRQPSIKSLVISLYLRAGFL